MKRSLSAIMLTAFILGTALMLGACATGGTPAVEDSAMDETRWEGDPRLYHILLPYPMGAAQQDSLRAYAAQHREATNYLLAEAADDENAPTPVRVNAMFALARRDAVTHMYVFRRALDAEDVRVRATAVAAMREILPTYPREAIGIARMALLDPAPEVQAQALQVLSDSDIDLLRAYVQRAPNMELRTIAQDLIRLAEQRGAPLRPDSATGVLTRETSTGFRITFTPVRHWPQWNAGYGNVSIEKDGVTLHTIAHVESVGGVIPVFLSPDGRQVVFERDREIVVRALADGREQIVGPGIAPRARPFTEEFLFMREKPDAAVEQREKTVLSYDVFSAPFDPPGVIEPELIGSATATVSFGNSGGYSPVRWMRVEERSGTFYLTSSDMEIVPLPDPFA